MNLRRFFTSGFLAHWQIICLVLLLAAIGVQQIRVTGLKSSLLAEKAGRAADRQSYEKVQAQAAVDAYAAKIRKETEDAKKAEAADARADDLAARYRALSLQYASAQRAAGKADLPQSAKAPPSSDGPGGLTIVPVGSILITQADALICADNTARLEAVREWATALDAEH